MADTVLGIDLGTTNSAVAITEAGEAEILKNAEGDLITPSVVRFPTDSEDSEKPYVGAPALNGAEAYPDRTVKSIKRHMGEDYVVKIDDNHYSPPDISGFILRKLRTDAADRLDKPENNLTKATITVPAYFTEDQTQATIAAAKRAQFGSLETQNPADAIDIIREPVAAAMAYGYDEDSTHQTVLVYDLGGGTFDVSVMEIGDGSFDVQATNGDRHLGGDDWDEVVMEWAADKFEAEHGVNPLEDQSGDDQGDLRERRHRLREAAKDAKERLCSQGDGRVTLRVPYLMVVDGNPQHLEVKLGMQTFQDITEHLLEDTLDPTMDAITEAGYSSYELDEILLVGGSTRMPQVSDRLEEEFNITPDTTINPDEAVAKGAAIHGNEDDISLQQVTPLSLGVKVKGGLFKPIIDRNTRLPASASKIFTTSKDNQRNVRIEVFQGERKLAEKNRQLKEFYLTNIPPAPQGVPQIEVEFTIDTEGIITASAHELSDTSGDHAKTVTIEEETATELSDEQVKQFVREAREMEEEDEKHAKKIRLREDAVRMVGDAKTFKQTYEDNLSEGDLADIEDAIEKVNQLREDRRATVTDLEEALDDLSDLLKELGGRRHQEGWDAGGSDAGDDTLVSGTVAGGSQPGSAGDSETAEAEGGDDEDDSDGNIRFEPSEDDNSATATASAGGFTATETTDADTGSDAGSSSSSGSGADTSAKGDSADEPDEPPAGVNVGSDVDDAAGDADVSVEATSSDEGDADTDEDEMDVRAGEAEELSGNNSDDTTVQADDMKNADESDEPFHSESDAPSESAEEPSGELSDTPADEPEDQDDDEQNDDEQADLDASLPGDDTDEADDTDDADDIDDQDSTDDTNETDETDQSDDTEHTGSSPDPAEGADDADTDAGSGEEGDIEEETPFDFGAGEVDDDEQDGIEVQTEDGVTEAQDADVDGDSPDDGASELPSDSPDDTGTSEEASEDGDEAADVEEEVDTEEEDDGKPDPSETTQSRIGGLRMFDDDDEDDT